MIVKRHFSRIHLQEAYLLFGLVKVDFDETYPHQTAKLQAWIDDWKNECHLPDIAKKEGKAIRVITHEGSHLFKIDTPRDIVIEATVVLINLVRPYVDKNNRDSFDNIIKNIFKHEVILSEYYPHK